MIIVRVELHSVVTGSVTELARAIISNVGGDERRGDYNCMTLRGRNREALDKRTVQRFGEVKDYPRQAIHVWNLVAEALTAMRYGRTVAAQPNQEEHEDAPA